MAGRINGPAANRRRSPSPPFLGDRGKRLARRHDRHDRLPHYMLPDHPSSLIAGRPAFQVAPEAQNPMVATRAGFYARGYTGDLTGFLTGKARDDALRISKSAVPPMCSETVPNNSTIRFGSGSTRETLVSSDVGRSTIRTGLGSSSDLHHRAPESPMLSRYMDTDRLPYRDGHGNTNLAGGARQLSPDPQGRGCQVNFESRLMSPRLQRRRHSRSKPPEYLRPLSPGDLRGKARAYDDYEPSRKYSGSGEGCDIFSEEEVPRKYHRRDDIVHVASYRDVQEGEYAQWAEIPPKRPRENRFYEMHRLHEEESLRYHEMDGFHECYVGSSRARHHGCQMEMPHQRKPSLLKEDYDRDSLRVVDHRKSRSPEHVDHHRYTYGDDMISQGAVLGRDMYRRDMYPDDIDPQDMDHPQEICREGSHPHLVKRHIFRDDINIREADYYKDVDAKNITPDRWSERNYIANGVVKLDAHGSRNMYLNDDSVFRRIAYPGESDEHWHREDRRHRSFKVLYHVHPRYDKSRTKLSAPFRPGCVPEDEGGVSINVRKRLGPVSSQCEDPYASEQDGVFRPTKLSKFIRTGDIHGNCWKSSPSMSKEDPVEGSVEFKQEVNNAFMKFIKMFYESPNNQRPFQNPDNGEVICWVCGSSSKTYRDTHCLVEHAFKSCKVGLKTKHLGLHKAICFLLGWDWRVIPNTRKNYLSCPTAEMKALKEDCILWPPIVIVYNSSIRNKVSAGEAMMLTLQDMETILRGFGVELGKAKVNYGKPPNRSVFLVKFLATFSGLQEADALHKHFTNQGRGKDELQHLKESGGDRVHSGDFEEVLYGCIAGVEELVSLDEEAKKRCIIKSRKDIEAIADAPLKI